jgi:hypothetical protein
MALVLQPNADGSPDDHHVMHGGWQLGRIYKRQNALRPETQWLWSISGVSRGRAEMRFTGMSGTLDEALAAMKESWDKWLVCAQLTAPETDAGTDRTPKVLSVVISKSVP